MYTSCKCMHLSKNGESAWICHSPPYSYSTCTCTTTTVMLTDLLYDAVVCEGCTSSVHLAKTSLVDQLTDGLQVRVAALLERNYDEIFHTRLLYNVSLIRSTQTIFTLIYSLYIQCLYNFKFWNLTPYTYVQLYNAKTNNPHHVELTPRQCTVPPVAACSQRPCWAWWRRHCWSVANAAAEGPFSPWDSHHWYCKIKVSNRSCHCVRVSEWSTEFE